LLEWADGCPSGTVAQLAGMHRAAATDGFGREVSAIVRGTWSARSPTGSRRA
jgi:hypothetical protein